MPSLIAGKLQVIIYLWIIPTIETCPTAGDYVRISSCSTTEDQECPESAICINGACCMNAHTNRTGPRCPGTGKHSSGRCKRWAYGCGGYRWNICGNCCQSNTAYVSCPTTGYVSSTVCYVGCPVCYSGYCCSTAPSIALPPSQAADRYTCPDGTVSYTRCTNNACNVAGAICISNFCCPPITAAITSDRVTCPGLAVVSYTRCVNNVCVAIPSQICHQGFCCPGTRCSNGMISTTPCINNVCTIPGQECQAGYCCLPFGPGGLTGSVASGQVICPATGTVSRIRCMNDVCTAIPDIGCYAGYCCPLTNSVTCPLTGTVSTTACVDNVCAAFPGQGCVRGFCCQTTTLG